MSFGTTNLAPQPQQKLLNVTPARTSTNQAARPLPWFTGRQRLGVTWLRPAKNVTTVPVTNTTSTGKSSTTTQSGYDYYADLLCAVCHGPVNAIATVWLDGTVAYDSLVIAGTDENDQVFNINNRGDCKIFWGNPLQESGLDGQPDFRRQCVLSLPQFYFGTNVTNAPNIEVELIRHPVFDWLPTSTFTQDWNPIASIVDALTNPLLYGLSADLLDQAQLVDAFNQLQTEGWELSPLLTSVTPMKQFLTDFCSYFNGVPRWVNGKLQVQLTRSYSGSPSLLVLNEQNLSEVPQLDTGEWQETINKTAVVFNNRDADFTDATWSWSDIGNWQLTGSQRVQALNRPWIMTPVLAQMHAQQAGRLAAVPLVTGTVKPFERVARALRAGDYFNLQYAAPALNLVCRVTERRIERAGARTVELTWEADLPQVGLSTSAVTAAAAPQDLSPVAPMSSRAIVAPTSLGTEPLTDSGGDAGTVAILTARGSTTSTAFTVWASSDDTTYTPVGDFPGFALRGVLGEDYPVTADPDPGDGLLLDLTGSPDRALDALGSDHATLLPRLLLVDNELMHVSGATMLSAGVFRLTGLHRARYGTANAAHASAAEVFIIDRHRLALITNNAFATGSTWYFKIQPRSVAAIFDLSLVTPMELTF